MQNFFSLYAWFSYDPFVVEYSQISRNGEFGIIPFLLVNEHLMKIER